MTSRTAAGRIHVVRDPEQLKVLRTPTRHRVLNAILELGPCSVSEIAHRLEWKPESLYYHVKALLEVGLIVAAGERQTDRRAETLYAPVAPEIQLDDGDRTPEYLAAVWDTYRAALRATERELERALEKERDGSGPRKNTMLHQANVRMSPSDAAKLREMLDEVMAFALGAESREGSTSVSLTMALSRLPVEGRD